MYKVDQYKIRSGLSSTETKMKISIGIDIAKLTFEAALLINKKFYAKKFGNNPAGFIKFRLWLETRQVSSAHVCMEATGKYGLQLAEWLCANGFVVSMVNPASIKGFAQSQLSRNKTDTVDAKLIAQYTAVLSPEPWVPAAPEVRHLRGLVDRYEQIQNNLLQEKNRLELQNNKEVREHIEKHVIWLEDELAQIEKAIRQHIEKDPNLKIKNELLNSISGIGERTSATFLAYISFERFKSAKEVAAFIGVNPRQRTSGTSIRGRTRLSKTGNSYLRKSLYMPSLAALRFNDSIKRFAAQLSKNGKKKMVIIGAVMRKLVHMMYGVIKSRQPFDPAYAHS